MKRYQIQAKSKSADIWIYSEIGGYWDGVTAKQFADDMKSIKDVDEINLHINSPGGDVFDGVAIYNILRQHKAKVKVYIDGLAASIASVIAMAGDEINMAENAMMMVHQAWGVSIGNSDEMRKYADMLEKVDGTIIDTYCKRKRCDQKQIEQLVSDETWMTAQEAFYYGLVDNIEQPLEMAAFDLSRFKYRNTPRVGDALNRSIGEHRGRLAKMNLTAQKMKRK